MTYRSDPYLFRPRKRRSPWVRFVKWTLFLAVMASLVLVAQGNWVSWRSWLDRLPVPHTLRFAVVELNGDTLKVKNGAIFRVNPKDRIGIGRAETDGWIRWGLGYRSEDFDVKSVLSKPRTPMELLPGESFEKPKDLRVEVAWLDKRVGQFTIHVQWDAKGWLAKANSAGDLERKIAYVEQALHEAPQNVLVKTRLAQLYEKAHRYAEAQRLYEEVLEKGISEPVLRRLLDVYKLRGKKTKALGLCLQWIQLSGDPKIFEEFLAYLKKALKRRAAEAYLAGHLNRLPKSFRGSAFLVLAQWRSELGDWASAAGAYEKALASGVHDPNVYYNLSVVYRKLGRPAKAAQALRKYLKKHPHDRKEWLQVAIYEEKAERWEKALDVYKHLLTTKSDDVIVLSRMIEVLERLGKDAELLDAYRKLAGLQPENRVVQFNLALSLYKAQQWSEAANAFTKVSQLDPQDPESLKYLLDIYQRLHDPENQLKILQKLIVVDKKNLSYLDTLFTLLQKLHRYKTMVQIFQKVSTTHPNLATVHQYVLYGALKTHDRRAALKALEALIRLKPHEKRYLKQAATLYEQAGNYQKALQKVEQIIRMDPSDQQAKDDYLRLRVLILEGKKTTFFYCIAHGLVV